VCLLLAGLEEIPEVSVQILEDRDGSVRLRLRLADEAHASRAVRLVVPFEVVRVQEERDPAPV
jgi:hypothetical protein